MEVTLIGLPIQKDNLYLMDELGIDIQVLHCSGHLEKYHKRVLKENPGRFAAIGKIDHRLLPHEEGLEKLKAQIDDFGFHGIYYDPWHPDVRKSQGFDPAEWGSPDPFFHFDDKRYDPYKHNRIATHITQFNCFLKITREIIPTNGTYKVLKKAALEICDFCNAYCCRPIPTNKAKPVAQHKNKSLLL